MLQNYYVWLKLLDERKVMLYTNFVHCSATCARK
jgi:hypothetical protein